MYWLVVGVLVVWRVTHLVSQEDGPWGVLARVRRRTRASLLGCFYCMSVWIAAPIAWMVGADLKERALLWLAFSGGAVLLERATARESRVPPAAYIEEPEADSGVLRKE